MNPAEKCFAVTPDDGAELTSFCRGLYVGNAGNVAVILIGDQDPVTFVNVAAGSLLPLRVKQVMATGTTATNLVGVY